MNTILQGIKNEVERQQISRYKLSKLTGFSESQLSRWFNGEIEPSISKVEKMAEALGLKIEVKPINTK